MEAIEELEQLSDSMRQASAVLADEDVDENSRRQSTFLNAVALGNTVSFVEFLCSFLFNLMLVCFVFVDLLIRCVVIVFD